MAYGGVDVTRRHKTAYLTKRLKRAHNDLANPTAPNDQRRAARCAINRVLRLIRVPRPMRRPLEVDRLAARTRRATSGVR